MNFIKEKAIKIFKNAGIIVNGDNPWDIQVHNEKFYSRLLFNGSIALGESYVDGWWDCQAIDQFVLRLLKANLVNFETGELKNLGIPLIGKLKLLSPILRNFQNKKKANYNANFHYSMGNDLFEATLGKTMAYSCGYWKNAKNLDESQINKFELICRKLHLKPGMKILDIGFGWGNLSKYMVDNYNVKVTAINLSTEQYDYALKNNNHENIEYKIQDYRNLEGKFDRIVSVGMIEHVGPKNHKIFMQKVFDLLKGDGLILIQSIGISKTVLKNDPWVDKYLFPGSVPLSAKQFCDSSEGLFYILDWHDFTKDYHKTMIEWYNNFEKNWPNIKDKYGDRFYRYWKWYLLSCPATALAMTHHLRQVVFGKVGSQTYYERPEF